MTKRRPYFARLFRLLSMEVFDRDPRDPILDMMCKSLRHHDRVHYLKFGAKIALQRANDVGLEAATEELKESEPVFEKDRADYQKMIDEALAKESTKERRN